MLPGVASQPVSSGGRHIRERDGKVGEGDSPSPWQRQPRQVAEPPAGAEGQWRRQPGQARRQTANEPYAERRRRSRTSSTTIGMSESAMTTTTTMWMRSLMLGTTWPRR